MASHPLNLGVRFLLEVAGLLILGVWGWQTGEGWLRFGLALGLPVIAAAIWGTFNVADDPSRSGKAPVPVPGWLRLLIELALFGSATWALFDLGYRTLGWLFGGVVAVHYLLSYARLRWLLRQ